MAELEDTDIKGLVNIFFNTILYINDPSRVAAETEEVRTRKFKVGGKKGSCSYIYLKPPKRYKSISETGEGGKIDKRFIVRGHWRNQAYGEKLTQRKRIWIQLFWKGPELSEVVNKSYLVK